MPEPSIDQPGQRIIVSNTGPFISLEKITGGFFLLRSLYDRVFIPLQVLFELALDSLPTQNYLKERSLEDLVIVENVTLPEDSDLYLQGGTLGGSKIIVASSGPSFCIPGIIGFLGMPVLGVPAIGLTRGAFKSLPTCCRSFKFPLYLLPVFFSLAVFGKQSCQVSPYFRWVA